MLNISDEMKEYFNSIEREVERLYNIAKAARTKGVDPKLEPEISPAKDVAARVEGLIGPEGVANRIRELLKSHSREEVAFKIADEIVNGKFGSFDQEKGADLAIRAALAILTEGITAGPIEGIAGVKIKNNFDGSRYIAIYFAGPIRAAGGTEAAQTVIVGDFVRRILGLDRYKPTDEEIERYVEEVDIYDKIMNLQYPSSPEEIREAVKNIPIEITGEPTEKAEVKGFRDLPRIETNRVRGGAVLVLNDGVLSKAPKLAKIVQGIGITGWDWLKTIKKSKGEEKKEKDIKEIKPNNKYIADVIAGRPVFSHPSATGGFRLRYGRGRNTGLAGAGINPATMYVLDNFLAPGTHIRTERPGKGSIVMPVDTIRGPTVLLNDGTVIEINTVEEAKKYSKSIKEILFLGDLLLGYGEFLENNHILLKSGYVPEWWSQELKAKIKEKYDGDVDKAAEELGIPTTKLKELIEKLYTHKITSSQAVLISEKLNIPIHPNYTYHWHDVTAGEVIQLIKYFKSAKIPEKKEYSKIEVEYNPQIKKILEKLCLPHKLMENKIIIEEHALPLLKSLGLTSQLKSEEDIKQLEACKDGLEAVNKVSIFKIRAKAPHYIGARMGRPEKAKPRAMSPPVHSLFPIGLTGGPRRSILKAQETKVISVEAANVKCPNCGYKGFESICPNCKTETTIIYTCPNCNIETTEKTCPNCKTETKPYTNKTINIQELYQKATKQLGINNNQDVKCVIGMMSKNKYPEPLEKGILRAKHGLYVYKDGTIRFDMTDSPLTHFKPKEVKAPLEKLKKLGYTHDYLGNPLTSPEQILELKPQDIVIPHTGAEYLIKTAQFIDELLIKLYNLPPYYNVKTEEDLIGQLVMGLAPHTSAAIIGRIIGFTTANMCYAHPLWHAAKRRNCIAGEESIAVYNERTKEVEIKPIKEYVEDAIKTGAKTKIVDDFGTIEVENKNP
ncbi:MAG: DNA polymerase II large subunit, partial [Candidatus Odinarchaeia archaeon]